ncbi:competence protein ComEA [Bacillota bacterium]
MDFSIHKKKIIIIVAVILLAVVSTVIYCIKQSTGEDVLLQKGIDLGTAVEPEREKVPEVTGEAEINLVIDVAGEVSRPAVYIFPDGARVYEAIDAAGGLTVSADTRNINLAAPLSDGTKLYIPCKTEVEDEIKRTGNSPSSVISGNNAYSVVRDGSGSRNGLININTADSTELQKLTGVGPVTAEKIITYRSEYGKFSQIEDLMNVSGIGEKTFGKLKNSVTVE